MTAAGIEVAKVKPTFRPRYTFAAVNTSVIIPPMIMPRSVSSLSDVSLVACGADTNIPLAALNRYPASVVQSCGRANDERGVIKVSLHYRVLVLVRMSGFGASARLLLRALREGLWCGGREWSVVRMLLDVAATAAGALPSTVSPCRDCLTFVVVVVVVVSWKRSRSGLCVWVRGLGA